MKEAILPAATREVEGGDLERLKNIGKFCAKAAGLSAAAAALGTASMFLLPADSDIGAHRADITLSGSEYVEFDLGFPGSIHLPMENPLGLGATIEIKENSGVQSTIEQTEFTEADVQEYVHMFSGFERDIAEIKDDLVRTGAQRSLLALGALAGFYGLIGNTRRRELTEGYAAPIYHSRRTKALAAGLIFYAGFSGGMSYANPPGKPADRTFDGTVLEDAFIEGKPLQVFINKYGKEALDSWKQHESFYDTAVDELRLEYETGFPLRKTEDTELLLFFTDLHCNTGMAKVIGEAVKLYKPTWVANAGDATMSGTPLEEFCIDQLTKAIGDTPHIVGLGNHDDEDITGVQLKERGAKVLDGKTQRIEGLTVLGDGDPKRSVIGQPTRPAKQESYQEMSRRLANEACAQPDNVDLLLVHTPETAADAIKRGCARLVLTGHMHNETLALTPLTDESLGLHLTGGTAGGLDSGRPPIGAVQKTAPFYVIELGKHSHRPLRFDRISVESTSDVRITREVLFPKEIDRLQRNTPR